MKRDQRAYVGKQFVDWACGVAEVNQADVAELAFGVNRGQPFVIIYNHGHGVAAVIDLAGVTVGAAEVKAGTAR